MVLADAGCVVCDGLERCCIVCWSVVGGPSTVFSAVLRSFSKSGRMLLCLSAICWCSSRMALSIVDFWKSLVKSLN